MARFWYLPIFAAVTMCAATEPPGRVIESVLPSLTYGHSCWSSIDLENLGDRTVTVEVEAHRANGALAPLVGHPQIGIQLNAGARASYKLDIDEETGDAWVKIRERIPSAKLSPVVAVSGHTECVAGNRLHTTAREVTFPTRNPWFSGDIDEIRGNLISLVNASEHSAKAVLCYSAGNLYSLPNHVLGAICSNAYEVQIPPFGARQFPVEQEGTSHFSIKTQGETVVLQMLRPLETGVKVYKVDSTIKFGEEATR